MGAPKDVDSMAVSGLGIVGWTPLGHFSPPFHKWAEKTAHSN